MPFQKTLNYIVASLIVGLGNSFPAQAQSHEKDLKACEAGLTGGSARAVQVELLAELAGQGVSGMALTAAEKSLWLMTADKSSGTVRLFEPLKSNVALYEWQNLRVSQDRAPIFHHPDGAPVQLILFDGRGGQALEMDFVQPSRVRIMPVGGFNPNDGKIQKFLDDSGGEISISVKDPEKLVIEFARGQYPNIVWPVTDGGIEGLQVIRGKNSEFFILLARSPYTNSTILSLKSGALHPVAVVPSSYLFNGAAAQFVAWAEAGVTANQFSVNLARIDSLTTPDHSFPLEDGEIVKSYESLSGSELHGFLAVLTNRRILLFRYSSH